MADTQGCIDAGLSEFVTTPKAAGDPHLLNIKGERFNIARQGSAPLVNIASDGTSHLEVVALIEGAQKCRKKMFITQVNSSGSWLEKNVAVIVGKATGNQAFNVMVDGQDVWSPPARGYAPPATENIVLNHADKFSITEMSTKNQPGIQVLTAHDVKLKIVRPMIRAATPPHLNFDIQGLTNLRRSFKLGGLLGEDDHAYWIAQDLDCGASFAATEMTEGSSATAQ